MQVSSVTLGLHLCLHDRCDTSPLHQKLARSAAGLLACRCSSNRPGHGRRSPRCCHADDLLLSLPASTARAPQRRHHTTGRVRACRSQLARQCPYGTVRPAQTRQRDSNVAFFLSADKQLSAPASGQGRRGPTTMMPMGVPKLPYRVRPGRTQWIDLWNIFYLERIIWITKPIDNALANELIATMLYLDADKQKPMQVRTRSAVSLPLLASMLSTMIHVGLVLCASLPETAMVEGGHLVHVAAEMLRFCVYVLMWDA